MKENITLYFFQGIASILVVFIHIPFPGELGTVVAAWARISVPLFFMISGYTLYPYIDADQFRKKISQRIKRNGVITVICLSIYFFVDIAKCILKRESVWTFLGPLFSKANIVKLITLGIIPPGTGGVLWFMIALVYIYILLLFLEPLLKKKHIKMCGGVAFISMVLFGLIKIIMTAFDLHIGAFYMGSNWIYGNWIAIGLPAVIIGISMRKVIEDGTLKNFRCSIVLAVMALCIIATSIESLILDWKLDLYLSYSVFTLIVDCCIFVLAQRNYFRPNNPLVKVGKYYSRNLYLWHPLVMSAVSISVSILKLGNNMAVMYLQPVAVLFGALLLSVALFKLERRLTNG